MWLEFSTFHFLRPLWLFGLALPIGFVLHVAARGGLSSSWTHSIAPHLLPHLVHGSKVKRWGPASLLVPTALLGCLAMAGPSWRLVDDPQRPDDTALIMVLEVSASMDAKDVGPSRLGRARLKMTELLEQRAQGRSALLAYAGSAHTVMPLTDDSKVILPYLEALASDVMPVAGERLETVVGRVTRALERAQGGASVLLITDGVAPEGREPFINALEQSKARLIIWPFGTEDTIGGTPPLDSQSLQVLADSSGGTIVWPTLGGGDIAKIMRLSQLGYIESRKDDPSAQWQDEGLWLTVPFALLVLFWFRRGWVLRFTVATALLSMAGCTDDFRAADPWLTRDQQGRLLFEKGEYKRAAESFENPMWQGLSAYVAEDWDGAIAAFSRVETPEGYYNLGNAYAQANRLVSAIAAFQRALELRPTFREARANHDLLKSTFDAMKESTDTEEQGRGPSPDSAEQAVKLGKQQRVEDAMSADLKKAALTSREQIQAVDAETRALWMRRVATKPGKFLQRKFASQVGPQP